MTAFEGVVECLCLEAVAEDKHVAKMLLAGCCDHLVCIEGDDLILDELNFGVLKTLEVFRSEDDAFAAWRVLHFNKPG